MELKIIVIFLQRRDRCTQKVERTVSDFSDLPPDADRDLILAAVSQIQNRCVSSLQQLEGLK
jgi:hypothetical protein